ncbi:MAG: PqqD family protein [Bacteroidales bacterium]|nr:PqqD family protein [Bacteroidales bacterium]
MKHSKPKPNFLEMVPVRHVQEFIREEERITLLIPKFKTEWMRKWLVPSRRSPSIRIHLDAMGSKVWELIDGQRNTAEICRMLKSRSPESQESDDEFAMRVTGFLRNLYKNRFIVFR